MADILSAANGVRTIGRVSRLRLRYSSSNHSEERAAAQPTDEDESVVRVCLEILQDKDSGETLYRLIDVATGAMIREWRSGQLHELRGFLQENRIQFLDETV